MITNRRQFFLLLLLAALTTLVYGNTLEAPFYLDDAVNIVENPFVRLTDLSSENLVRSGFESPCSNRPLPNISFGLNYLIDRYNPTGYHIFNIIVHIVNGILLYFFTKTTLRVNAGDPEHTCSEILAFFAALIWLVHPLQTQSVTYVVQRMNSMAAMFYMASLLWYTKGRLAATKQEKWLWFLGCLVSWILALASKEIAATLPFFLLLYEWLFFQHGSTAWLRGNLGILAGVILVFGLPVLAYTDFAPFRAIFSGYTHRDFTPLQRVFTQFPVIGFYVGLILYPHPSRLSLLHDFDISRSLIDPPSTLIWAAAIVVCIFGAFWLARKEPLLSFSILWFLGNLMIESSMVSLEIIFEHRTYLPSMLLCVSVVALSYRGLRHHALATSIMCIVVATFSWWTLQRNSLWNNELAFWQDCARKTHNDVRVYHSLANARLKNQEIDKAVEAYEKALDIAPRHTESLVGLGHALRQKGDITGAIAVHKNAIAIAPNNGACYNELGADYLGQNEIDLAIPALEKAVGLAPYSYRAYNNLGLAYARQRNISDAVSMYEKAIAIRPDFALAYNNLGTLFLNPRGSQRAEVLFRKALELDPRSADAHGNMGLALIHGGQIEKGIREIEAALQLEPNHRDATFNLARAYELAGNYEHAVKQYKKSLRLNPRDVEAHFNAGFVYLNHLDSNKQAVESFKRGLSIDPNHEKAKPVKELIYRLENAGHNDV
jgi:tetratricopeptide (TPR) repeat protein